MRKIVRSMTAAAICVIIGAQSIIPVEAAESSARVTICISCSQKLRVEARTTYKGHYTETCSTMEHQSLSCKISYDLYIDEYWLVCGCGIDSEPQTIVERRENEEHSCITSQ